MATDLHLRTNNEFRDFAAGVNAKLSSPEYESLSLEVAVHEYLSRAKLSLTRDAFLRVVKII